MKLFRIKVLHGGPKSSHTATETYLVAESDEAVAEWVNKTYCYGGWFGGEGDEPKTRFNEATGEDDLPFKDYVLEKKGDLEDEEGWGDAYYGVTKWGWEEVEGADPDNFPLLVSLGIAVHE